MTPASHLGKMLADGAEGRGITRHFDRGSILFHQGDEASSVHIINEGRVAVRLLTAGGERVTVAVAGPGDALGELALLHPGGRRTAAAEALDDVVTTVVDRPTFDDLRARRPELTQVVIELLAGRVRDLDEQLVEALYVAADVRVVRRLLDLGRLYGDLVPLRQEDLAGMAGTTRATVNRVLRRFAKVGAVSLNRGRIRLLDVAALQAAAGEPDSALS